MQKTHFSRYQTNDDYEGVPLLWFDIQQNTPTNLQRFDYTDIDSKAQSGPVRFSICFEDLLTQYAKFCNVRKEDLIFYQLTTHKYRQVGLGLL